MALFVPFNTPTTMVSYATMTESNVQLNAVVLLD
jgi:hypothetical protein